MGRKSSISRLPDQVRAYIEGRLADGRMTLDELIADLQAQFPSQAEAGELPSRAAVHRTARSWSGGWRQFVPAPRRPS
ncbi:DUF3486 family protein [Pseudomonas aeruginosa]|nr:DUF3486 family protein [Pseudomonas aeruginosa]